MLHPEKADTVVLGLIVSVFLVSACMPRTEKQALSVDATKPGEANYVADELLVQFMPGIDASKIKALNDSLGVTVVKILGGGQIYLIKIPQNGSLDEIRRTYSGFPEVKSVGLNYKVLAQ